MAVSAYLTAVYLTVGSDRAGEHGLRAISPGALAAAVLAGILAAVTMAVLHSSTPRVFTNLTTARALPLVVVSVLSGAAVVVLLPLGRIRLARLLAVAAVVALSQAFNKDPASVYKKFANVCGAFRTADLTDMVTTPAFGTVPLDVAMVCWYTWECAPPPVGPNGHANVLGYGVIANTFLKTYIGLSGAG